MCLELVATTPQGRREYISFGSPNDGSGRIFANSRDGVIVGWKKTESGLYTNLGIFLDWSGKVQTDGEGGLLGLAFHPNYSTNGRFFVVRKRLRTFIEVLRVIHVIQPKDALGPVFRMVDFISDFY